MYFERTRGVRSSIPLFSFFSLHLLFFLPSLQHDLRYLASPHHLNLHLPRVVIFLINFLFVLIQVVNFCFVEPPPYFGMRKADNAPELSDTSYNVAQQEMDIPVTSI